jgi:lipopolysaccharide export system permease protein
LEYDVPVQLPPTLSGYIARQVLGYSALGLLAVSLLFVGQNLLRHLDRFLMIGITFADFLTILKCVVVTTLAYTLPIAFLFGVLVAVGRMAADSEITAMRANGVRLRDLVAPVLALAMLVSGFSAYLALELEHRSKRELREMLVTMTASGAMFEARRFTRLGDHTIYVRARHPDDQLEGVMISDRSDPARPLTVFAERGRFRWDRARSRIRLHLEDGDLHFGGDVDADRRISFETFDYAISVEPLLEVGLNSLRPKDMTLDELRGIVAEARAGGSLDHLVKKRVEYYEAQIHRRFALPVAPVLFALAGLPLSLRRSRGARARGALLCALLAGIYYAILSFGQYRAQRGDVPPALALWLPNAAFALLAALLLGRARGFRS